MIPSITQIILRKNTRLYIAFNAMNRIVLEHTDVLNLLPNRKADSHKGNYGRLLMLCGSRGYTGAAALAAMGALRSGAGLVFLGVPQSIYAIEAIKLLEPVVFPLPDEDGMFSEAGLYEIRRRMNGMDAILIGPGLGQSPGTKAVLECVLRESSVPVIVDADGINLLARHTDIVRGRKATTVLTPHPGEFYKIGGMTGDREKAALDMAKHLDCIIVLKGHETVITDGNQLFLNKTGNPGMAVGGSGDVLAGMIAALIAQGIDPLAAAACGVWIHGRAGDVCAEKLGQYGMLPSDMLLEIPRLMK